MAGAATTDGALTAPLAAFLAGLRFEDLPGDVVHETKLMLLDTLGCIVAARGTGIGPLAAAQAALFGGAAEPGPLGRAYALGRLGNAMDFEEGTPAGSHFGCGAVGAALALARGRRLSGRDLLLAVAAGYELGGRVADAIGPYYRIEDGRATSFAEVWGVATPVVFAAAGAAARLLGHDARLTAQAYGLAGSNTPVPIGAKWAGEVDLPNTKYVDAGWCTLTGVAGALSAPLGSTGLADLLDGPRGLFAMVHAVNAHPAILTDDLGGRWRVRQVLYKRWPCCRWIHYPLTALAEVRDRHGLSAGEIERVTAEAGFAATSARFANRRPRGFTSLQFSIPHAVAMLLLDVPPGPLWLCPELAERADVAALRERVDVVEHHRKWRFEDFRFQPGPVARRMSSGAVVQARGTAFRAETDFCPGDAHGEWRWGEAEVTAKLRSLVAAPHCDRLVAAAMGIEALADAAPLLEAFEAAQPAAHRPPEPASAAARSAGGAHL